MCDHENREAAMVTLATDADGTPTVWCDPCIAPIVKALNDAGIPTVASCCGHGTRHGSIVLADGRDLRIHRFVEGHYAMTDQQRKDYVLWRRITRNGNCPSVARLLDLIDA